MAEPADQPHAEQLPGLFLETADQRHGAINGEVVAGAQEIGQPAVIAGTRRGRRR